MPRLYEHRVRRIFCALLAVIALVLPPSRAFADPQVDELKKRGNDAMVDLNYAEAVEAYTAAIAIAPDDASLYYNVGRAQQARGDYPAALDALEQFAQKASPEMRARVPKYDQLVGDVRARVATLEIRCSADVPDATVVVADKTTINGCTVTPKAVRISVAARSSVVEVRLSAESVQGQTVRIPVEGGGPLVPVSLAVLPKTSSGTLLVRAIPSNARISVDGVERGNSPLEVPLAAGPHAVDVRADRYDSAHVPVVVEAGRTKDVGVELRPQAPMTSKWWFWTGIGVLAIGAGITTWYLIAQPESDASSGSIAPGQVSAPLRF